jgi:hypothetical protein
MKTGLGFAIFSFLFFGCASQNEKVVSTNMGNVDLFREKIISPRLLAEQIPFPENTPFDSDAKSREAYRNGFQQAWDYVASGIALHGTIGVSKPVGFESAWDSGWKDGYKIAWNLWRQESEKVRVEETLRSKSSP